MFEGDFSAQPPGWSRVPSAKAGPALGVASTSAPPAGASADGLWRGLLNLLDLGLMLVDRRGHVLFANRAALDACRTCSDAPLGQWPLSLPGLEPQAMQSAIFGAQEGRWSMVPFGDPVRPLSAAVAPVNSLAVAHTLPGAAALVVFQPPRPSTDLAMAFFKKTHRLTDTETEVLLALCSGCTPADIALARGVEVCTVRTQIASVRRKTGAVSIRGLQQMVAGLPPILGAVLRDARG